MDSNGITGQGRTTCPFFFLSCLLRSSLYAPKQGRTEEFGEGGAQYEFDEGTGQEVTVPRGLGLSPRIFCITRSVSIEKIN